MAITSKRQRFCQGILAWAFFAHQNAARHLKFSVDRVLSDQEEIVLDQHLALRSLYTPGHSDDHLVFFDAQHGILLAGDMMTDRGTVLIPPVTGSLKVYLDSLDRISRLPMNAIIPAHGIPITDSPSAFLIKGIKHRYERIVAVLDALIDSPDKLLDATDITHKVYRNLSTQALLAFAQMSVESSLAWLLEMNLIENVYHKWQAVSGVIDLKQTILIKTLHEIDKRLHE